MKTKKSKPIVIHQRFSESDAKYMESRGVPAVDLLPHKQGWSLNDSVIDVNNEDVRGTLTTVNVKKQLRYVERFYKNPLDSMRCMCISSIPSDLKAKQLALHLFWKATLAHRAGERPNRRQYSTPPLWHRLYGGFDEPLLTQAGERPSLLVLTNVLEDSTASKIEKTRDLLEKFSDVPRILVTGGTDPLQIFRSRLYYPVDACIYLDATGNMATIDRVL